MKLFYAVIIVCVVLLMPVVCMALDISSVLNDGQGGFDPWNTTRWADWYEDGVIVHSFDISCSVKFMAKSTSWEVDLSSLEGSIPRLFKITANSGIDIDGNNVIIDSRKDSTKSLSLQYYYNNTVATSNFGSWNGFYFKQTSAIGSTDPCTTLHDITLRGFLHAIDVDHYHKRRVIVSDCNFWTNVWAVFARGANIVITGNTLKENLLGGVYSEYNSNNWTFENNIFRDNNVRGAVSYADIVLDACYQHYITGNQFLESSYTPRDYHTAISLYRNRGEDGDIREYASSRHLIEDNYFNGYHIAIDFSPREASSVTDDQSLEGRCYSNNNAIRNCSFEDCTIGLNVRSHYNNIENNTFTNVEKAIVLFCIYYKSLGNSIVNQPDTTVWLWRSSSDYSAYSAYIPYGNGYGAGIANSEKLFFVCSDGTATISNPSPSQLLVAPTLIRPDSHDYNGDLFVDESDLWYVAKYWLDQDCLSYTDCINTDTTGDDFINFRDYNNFSSQWKTYNDLQDFNSTGGVPIDVAVGDFAVNLPGDEIAVIWDRPVSEVNDTNYYSIIIYDTNGLEIDRAGRSTRRWDCITAGNFLSDTGYITADKNCEIAAVSSIPDANNMYPVYIFRKGWAVPAKVLLGDNNAPVADITAGNFYTSTDDYNEIAVVFEQGSNAIKYVKPSDVNYTKTTSTGYWLRNITSGNFDVISSNGDEIAAVERGGATTKLVALWDFETANGGVLADKAPAGSSVDNLSVVGSVDINDGEATITNSTAGALKASDSNDLDLSGSFTIWVRAKVVDDPTTYISLVDKRRFSNPEHRSYAFLVNHPSGVTGGNVSGYFSIGGQISEDGDNGSYSLFDTDAAETIPVGQIREFVMRSSAKGELLIDWLASTSENPTSVSEWKVVNKLNYNSKMESVYNSSEDLYIGNTLDVGIPCSTVEYYEVRIYNGWLNTEELANIEPSTTETITTSTHPIYYFRTGATAKYAASASSCENDWAALAGGNFDTVSTRDELAAVNAQTGEIEYYICNAQSPFKTVKHDAMDILPRTINAGTVQVGSSLGEYEQCDGFTSSNYGSTISSWKKFIFALPASAKDTTAIPVHIFNCNSDGTYSYHKMVPVVR